MLEKFCLRWCCFLENQSIDIRLMLYIIIAYTFLTPFYLAYLNNLSLINIFIVTISFLFIFIYYFKSLTLKYVSKGLLFIIMYYSFILISSIINNSIEYRLIISIFMAIAFALLINYLVYNQSELLRFLLAMNVLIYIYVIVNLILIYIYPHGIPTILLERGTKYYLFGNVNTTVKFLIPGLMFSFLHDILKYNRIRKYNWILLALSWLTLIKTWAVTGILGLGVFTFLILLRLKKHKLYLSYLTSLAISIASTIYLLFLKNESKVLFVFLDIFNKDLTFSTRDILWLNTWEKIKQSFIWGYGYQNTDFMKQFLGNSYGAHNYFLDTLFRGGIISFVLLISILLYISLVIVKSMGSSITRLLVATSASFFIMWIAEPFFTIEYLMLGIIVVLFSHLNTIESYYYDNIN